MGSLSEFDSKRLLAAHGVPVSRDELVRSPEEAVAAAVAIGGDVAVKLCGENLAHKSERGLVRLGLDNPEAVRAAGQELLGAATESDGDVGLLVSEMVSGHRELIAGVVHTPQFGAALMLGLGGVLAEAIGTVVFRLLPVGAVDCQDMIDDLGVPTLLDPQRGEPAVNRDALIGALLSLAEAARDDGIQAVDVNPLVIRNGLPVAVDALVVTSGPAVDAPVVTSGP
ncbi:acetate--CoA ligase family protein [Candidatus Poriferisocius sp.]|uniref:acetate--CoA ligase family protein n=1 Tax=Candidatus Poriferisocius sp. TaxID=3101276 RepID=UPI003B023DE5